MLSANRLCATSQNDCDKNAKCIEKDTNEYICICEPGYIDKSPDPNKPGYFSNLFYHQKNWDYRFFYSV